MITLWAPTSGMKASLNEGRISKCQWWQVGGQRGFPQHPCPVRKFKPEGLTGVSPAPEATRGPEMGIV
jgi:hypothetical protein